MEKQSNTSNSYRAAGVDTDIAQQFVGRIKSAVKSTHSPAVLDNYGAFAGGYDVSFLKNYRQPILISATDGVGTKLRLAALFNYHDTIGIDLVAMCSNDILVCGARPHFFLDYIACGKLQPQTLERVVASIADGCRQAGAALVGGETAEHPGLMAEDDYDLAGFMVGAAEKDELLDGSQIAPGDLLIALPSSGVHSNGLSLVRKIFLKDGLELPDSSSDQTFLREEILKPTIIYEPSLRPILSEQKVIKGMVHVTGGGFYENIPRILPDGLSAVIARENLIIPELFQTIQRRGQLDDQEMFSVFNMGCGMILFVAPENANQLLTQLKTNFTKFHTDALGEVQVIGQVEKCKSDGDQVIFRNSKL